MMNELFKGNNSDSETELKINTDYAHNYNSWRQKEELNKLKTKYGEHIADLHSSGEDSSTSEEEDEDGNELTEKFEKDFYKTLALLKNKDPRIYDEKVTFFDDVSESTGASKAENKAKTTKKPLYLRDYERKVMIERDGKFSDSEEEETINREAGESLAPTYVEEQRRLKESFKKIIDEDEDDKGDLLKPKKKTAEDQKKEEEAYKIWLKGQQSTVDVEEKAELKPLRDFWNDPKLDQNERFLRDYVLNKKFLDQESANLDSEYDLVAHDSDENLSEDEKNIETQEEFEHKYNFRFEEPDQEFIKRYPRTLENSMRRKDTRRAEKRVEIKKRKEEEAIRKREELKQLKALKRKEIEEKLEKLKEITGNDDMNFNEIDLDGDFDPAEHDRKMQVMFNDDFYAGPEGDQKPEFPDIDEELDVETTWDKYHPNMEQLVDKNQLDNGPHCDDPDFNMDADYDPTKTLQEELIDSSRKKKRRRRNKLALAIAKEKPKFDPSANPSYQAYLDQYYALDYEDMIGDQPCRFKYRNVVANDYGLTIDEIIAADDKELNKWCSLKKALQHRPEHLELNDVRTYRQKAQNEVLKKKIFKSIYGPKEEDRAQQPNASPVDQQTGETHIKKRIRKKKKNPTTESGIVNEQTTSTPKVEPVESQPKSNGVVQERENKGRMKKISESSAAGEKNISSTKLEEEDVETSEPRKKKIKKLRSNANQSEVQVEATRVKVNISEEQNTTKMINTAEPGKRGFNAKSKQKKANGILKDKQKGKVKMTHNKITKDKNNSITNLSAERLKAFGINPKKFKNKLKYGKKN